MTQHRPCPHRSVTRHAAPGAVLLTVLAGGLISCKSPLHTYESDFGNLAPLSRLRDVNPLATSRVAPKPVPVIEREVSLAAPPPSPFEGAETVEMGIEEARAYTLTNNLDLRVQMIAPTISAESVREEGARFEAVFRPSVRWNESDSPAFNVSDANQINTLTAGLGVDIPLRTGGRVSVDVNEGYNQTNNSFVVFNESYNSGLTFSVSQPLLRNAGRRFSMSGLRIAGLNTQISEAQTKLEVIRQLAAVDRAYWRLDAVKRELEVRQRQYELASEQMGRAQRRFDAGDVAQIEVIRAEAGLAERLEGIITAENALRDRQREFKRIINVPGLEMGSGTLVVPASAPDPVQYEFEAGELADYAVENRMEMLQLELQLAVDLTNVDISRNQALPLFTLDYRYTIAGLGESFNEGWRQVGRNNFESWQLGLTGSVPIGNEGAKARLNRAVLQRLQRLSTKEARRLAIHQEVFNAVDQVRANWQRILASRQAAIAAARAFEAEQNQFNAGASTSQDVLDQASRLADAQTSEIRAIAEYQIALVDVAFATGTILGASKVEWSPEDPSTPVSSVSDSPETPPTR